MVLLGVELAGGLLLLLGGGEALVRGSIGVATRLGVSPLWIGLTLVGFGTSTPELVTSLEAAFVGAPGIAIGNIVGSNIANILLILGVAAVLGPVAITRQAFRRDGVVLLSASLLLGAVVVYGSLSRWIGGGFLLLLGGYTTLAYRTERRTQDPAPTRPVEAIADALPKRSLTVGLLLVLAGIAGVVFGASLLVAAAIALAQIAGMPETVIGLTLVAVGTSLPELATSSVAAWRGHGDLAFGNIVGSNIFNSLGIAGATAAVSPFNVPPAIARLDIWVMLATAIWLVLVALTGWRISRPEGVAFLVGYTVYTGVLLLPGLRAAVGV